MLPTLALLGRALIECLNWIIDGVLRMGSDHFKRFHHNVPETHQWHIRWGSIHLEESPGQTHVLPWENLAVSGRFQQKNDQMWRSCPASRCFRSRLLPELPVSPTWYYQPTGINRPCGNRSSEAWRFYTLALIGTGGTASKSSGVARLDTVPTVARVHPANMGLSENVGLIFPMK